MGRIRDKIKPFGADFLLQIHDELLFQCPIEAIEEVKCLIKYEMENVVELTVPLQVEVATGYNWAELK
jgi:DNA polymerase-1